MLSELAGLVLDQLRQSNGGRMCPVCLAAALKVGRWDVLKSVRELVLTGKVLCDLDICSACQQRQLVARLRLRRRKI